METKTISQCLNYIDKVLLSGVDKDNTINELEYIRDFMIMDGVGFDIREILSSLNLIIESYYLNNEQTHFHALYTNLRKLFMDWLHNCKNPFDNDQIIIVIL